MAKVNVADKLGVDKFKVYEEESHILINKRYPDPQEIDHVIRVCPAALYHNDNGSLRFEYLGCLECGTCRVLSGGKVVEKWSHPEGGFGVSFRES